MTGFNCYPATATSVTTSSTTTVPVPKEASTSGVTGGIIGGVLGGTLLISIAIILYLIRRQKRVGAIPVETGTALWQYRQLAAEGMGQEESVNDNGRLKADQVQ